MSLVDAIKVHTSVSVEVGPKCIRSATYLVLAIAALVVALGWAGRQWAGVLG